MANRGDLDDVLTLVEQEEDAVGAATCGPCRRHRRVEGLTHPVGVVEQGADDEFVSCGLDLFGQCLGQCPGSKTSRLDCGPVRSGSLYAAPAARPQRVAQTRTRGSKRSPVLSDTA